MFKDINKLLKYLDLEEEADTTYVFNLGQNHSILKIEKVLERIKRNKNMNFSKHKILLNCTCDPKQNHRV